MGKVRIPKPRWLGPVGCPEERRKVVMHFVGRRVHGMAQDSPQEAANFVVSLFGNRRAQNRAAMKVVAQWSQGRSASRRAVGGGFPQGSTRDNALQNVVSSWAQRPSAARPMAGRVARGQIPRAGGQSFVSQLSSEFPEMAAPWTETMTEPNQRNNAIRKGRPPMAAIRSHGGRSLARKNQFAGRPQTAAP